MSFGLNDGIHKARVHQMLLYSKEHKNIRKVINSVNYGNSKD